MRAHAFIIAIDTSCINRSAIFVPYGQVCENGKLKDAQQFCAGMHARVGIGVMVND